MLDTPQAENSIFLSRTDPHEPLAAYSRHGFDLDGCHWPSVEHYFQGMKFEDEAYRQRVRLAEHPGQARKLGRTRFKRVREDWKKIRRVVMTRAVYTKCRTHSDVAAALLETGDLLLVENSAYDYFWGCGRDRRGRNTYGRVLMDVRAKLLEEREPRTEPRT